MAATSEASRSFDKLTTQEKHICQILAISDEALSVSDLHRVYKETQPRVTAITQTALQKVSITLVGRRIAAVVARWRR